MGVFDRQAIGQRGEESACKYLQAKGLALLQKNYRCIYGEIDLIMRDQDVIVFVEVRCRSREDYGTALESINDNKIQKLIKTATHFLQIKKWLHKIQSRFDVVAIQSATGKIHLEWIKNAF
jgi:putative endonuclease